MNKQMKKIAFFVVIVLLAVGSYCKGQAESEKKDIGRDDPFAGAFGDVGSVKSPDSMVSEELIQIKPALFVKTITLKFLEARNLQSALKPMSSKNGSMAVDDNTNTLIICDTNDTLQKIVTEVQKADQTPQQIMIEVVIIDVQLQDDTEIGVDWDLLTTEYKDVAYRQSLIYPNRLNIIGEDATTIANITANAPVGLGSELAIISDDIRSVVNLLQEKRNVDILASPRVMVVSGKKAEIKTVEEIPYQEKTDTSGGGQLTSTQFKEVGITLEVKATVTDDGKIMLEVKPKQSVNTGTSINSIPVVDTREASTTLLMDDGQVSVMGGLRRQEMTHVRYQVPLLGNIPIIGLLFSDDKKVVLNSELLVLLSPHIYKGEPISAEVMERYEKIRNRPLLSLPDKSQASQSKDE